MRWIAALPALVLLAGCSSVAGTAMPGPMPTPDTSADDTGGGWWSTTTFDHEAVQVDVRGILTDRPPEGFGLSDVGEVTCPDDVEVETGATFTCDVEIGGDAKEVAIVVRDDEGTYEVGYPG